MAERKINLPPALLGKAIDAIGVDGVTRLHERYVTIVDPDRLAALERLLAVEYDIRYQMLSEDEHKALVCEADEIVETLARMEAETNAGKDSAEHTTA